MLHKKAEPDAEVDGEAAVEGGGNLVSLSDETAKGFM